MRPTAFSFCSLSCPQRHQVGHEHFLQGLLRRHLPVEMASPDANVCIPQTSSLITVLMTHTGLRGALKDAHLLCPCGDLRVLVPCRAPAYRSPKQRVKEQLLCLAQKEVKAVFVAPKFCCLLLGWSSLAAGMAHKPDQDLIQPVAWAWSLQLVLQPFPGRQWHIHHRSSASPAGWRWWSCCLARSHILAVFHCLSAHSLSRVLWRRSSSNVPLSPAPPCALPTPGESQLLPVLLRMRGARFLLGL